MRGAISSLVQLACKGGEPALLSSAAASVSPAAAGWRSLQTSSAASAGPWFSHVTEAPKDPILVSVGSYASSRPTNRFCLAARAWRPIAIDARPWSYRILCAQPEANYASVLWRSAALHGVVSQSPCAWACPGSQSCMSCSHVLTHAQHSFSSTTPDMTLPHMHACMHSTQGVTEKFIADTNPEKINLGVGAYRDDDGERGRQMAPTQCWH